MSEKYKIPKWIIENSQIVDENGNIKDLKKDQEACETYLKEAILPNYLKFSTPQERLDYLIEHDYYESEFFKSYTPEQLDEIYRYAYDHPFKFKSYMGAFKFYNDYAMKNKMKDKYLETYEDRLVVIALYHAQGDFIRAMDMLKALLKQVFIPATPTFLNTGKKHRGEFVSCFLLEMGDSLNDISRVLEFSMQLSKLGGGVSIHLSNLRAKGEDIKNIKHVAKGVVAVAKLLDNGFRYADQMGQRQGAGAVYLNVFHSDIEDFLNSKKINADDDVRLKTLSLGVVIPDKMIELARENKKMALFYPHTIKKEYGEDFGDLAINMDRYYDEWVANPNVGKRYIDPRKLLDLIATVQGESGYPYIMFADNVNKVNPLKDKIKFSNLCTEILQPSRLSSYADYGQQNLDRIGQDISCNLASGQIENMMDNKMIKESVYAAMDIMNSVSDKTNIAHVPAVAKANRLMHSVGFGMMGLHAYLAKNYIAFGSDESIELVDVFFNIVNYYSLQHSMEKAKETQVVFHGFEESKYADGSYFDDRKAIYPKSEQVKALFEGIYIPSDEDWAKLKEYVMEYGLYNSNRLAIAPNGSTSYLMATSAGVTPIKQLVEERTYGNSKTYFPMPHLDTASFMYEDAYSIDNYKVIDVISTIQKHVDQGISFELCITSSLTTRDLVRYYLYAHHKGIKTLYYTRTRKLKVDECIACAV